VSCLALVDVMAFTLLHLLEAALFVANALAILHDKRFLAKYSLDKPAYGEGLKNQQWSSCGQGAAHSSESPISSKPRP